MFLWRTRTLQRTMTRLFRALGSTQHAAYTCTRVSTKWRCFSLRPSGHCRVRARASASSTTSAHTASPAGRWQLTRRNTIVVRAPVPQRPRRRWRRPCGAYRLMHQHQAGPCCFARRPASDVLASLAVLYITIGGSKLQRAAVIYNSHSGPNLFDAHSCHYDLNVAFLFKLIILLSYLG